MIEFYLTIQAPLRSVKAFKWINGQLDISLNDDLRLRVFIIDFVWQLISNEIYLFVYVNKFKNSPLMRSLLYGGVGLEVSQ